MVNVTELIALKHSKVDWKTTYLHRRLPRTQLKVAEKTSRPTVGTLRW